MYTEKTKDEEEHEKDARKGEKDDEGKGHTNATENTCSVYKLLSKYSSCVLPVTSHRVIQTLYFWRSAKERTSSLGVQ